MIEVLKWYIVICMAVLYVCYVMRNLFVLIDNLEQHNYCMPILLFILIILTPCVFEIMCLWNALKRREQQRANRKKVKLIKFEITDDDDIDESFEKIKEIIKEAEHDRIEENIKDDDERRDI